MDCSVQPLAVRSHGVVYRALSGLARSGGFGQGFVLLQPAPSSLTEPPWAWHLLGGCGARAGRRAGIRPKGGGCTAMLGAKHRAAIAASMTSSCSAAYS